MYRPIQKKGLGGLIGTGIGAIAGSFAGDPALGAQLGNMAGSGIESMTSNPNVVEKNRIREQSGYSYGYRNGGALPAGKMDGKASAINGPSHENGGVAINGQVEVEGNETMDTVKGSRYVFSDRLTVPKSKKTFAQRHKELKEQGASRESINSLAKMQERVSGRTDQMAHGGKMKKNSYRYGGKLKQSYYHGGAIGDVTDLGTIEPVTLGTTEVPEMEMSKVMPSSSSGGMNFDWGTALKGVAQYGPDVANILTGALAKDTTEAPTSVRPTSVSRSYRGYNINPLLSANRSAYRSVVADPNATVNQKLASQMAKTRGDQSAYAQKENIDQQASMQYDMADARFQGQANMANARFEETARQDRMMSEANRGFTGNFARQGYANLANKFLQSRREGNMIDRDKRMLEMYRSIYGGI